MVTLNKIDNPYYRIRMYFEPDSFYGSGSTIAQIMEGISALPQPKSFELVGLPGTGKTTHLQFLAHPEGAFARSKHRQYLSPNFEKLRYRAFPVHVECRLTPSDMHIFVYICSRFSEEWHRRRDLHNQQEIQLVEPDSLTEETAVKALEKACKRLDRSAIRPVLLLDDFGLPFEGMEESETTRLRPLRPFVAFVIATEERLNKVNPKAAGSPFFYNIGVVEFRGLDEEDATQLVSEPAAQAGYPFPKPDQTFILEHSERYSALLLRGCEALWTYRHKLKLSPETPLSDKQRDAFLGQLRSEFESFYRLYWHKLTEDEREALSSLAHSPRELSVGDRETLGALEKKTGLVEADLDDPALYEFSSPLFERFVSTEAEIKVAESQPSLTGLETRLYQYLLDHVDEVCTFEELHSAIWSQPMGESADERDHAKRRVQVAISRLRSKLRETEEADILSIRDQGYRLIRNSSKGTQNS